MSDEIKNIEPKVKNISESAIPLQFKSEIKPEDPSQKYSDEEVLKVEGFLEILQDYGVLRAKDAELVVTEYDNFPTDVYISQSQIRRFALRKGDLIEGLARPPKENERYLSL